nr:FAD-dependent oxidoreductase [Streptomyces cellulosae]
MKRIVVVGGSIAAVTAAQSLRAEGYDGQVTVLSEEPHPPYSRVPLSKGVLAGRESVESALLPLPLLRWRHDGGTATAVAVNHRLPVIKLKRLGAGAAPIPARVRTTTQT